MEEILDAKTQLLVAIGAARAAKCQNCFTSLYAAVEKVGVSDKEVRAAVAIGAKVAAKSHDFMATFIEQTTHGKVAAGSNADAAPSGCGCN